MDKKANISAVKRTVEGSRANRRHRREGLVPGNVYGHGKDSEAVLIRKDVLRKALLEHGLTAVYYLTIDKAKPTNVIIRHIQNDPVTREPIHIDLQHILMNQEITMDVPIRFLNKELLEMKRLLLMTQMDVIAVKGLPNDIPSAFEIEAEFVMEQGRFFVSDLEMPEGITTELDPDLLIASVGEAKVEIEEPVAEAEDEVEGEVEGTDEEEAEAAAEEEAEA